MNITKHKWGYKCSHCGKIAFYFKRKPLKDNKVHGSNVIVNNKQMKNGDSMYCQHCKYNPCELRIDKKGEHYRDFIYKNVQEVN